MSASAPPPSPGSTLAPSPPPTSTNSTVSPPPLTAAPPPATNSSSPPPTTTSPPPPTVSAPPPTTPPPPTTTTPSASPPPPQIPSLPPSTTPSASPPPRQTPSLPPTTTPSPPPPPPQNSSPPLTTAPPTALRPPPQTPAISSPPPPVTTSPPTIASPPPPSTLSPPPRRLSPPPSPSTTPSTPSGRSPFPPTNRNPPAAGKSNSGVSAGLVAGVAVSGLAIMVALILLFLCRRKKRRRGDEVSYNAPSSGPKDVGQQQQQQWQQQNAPPQAASSNPLPSPPAFTSSSTGSTSNYTASSPPTPSPGLVLGHSTNNFTYEELAKATNGFSDANLLGQGGFGYVHKGVLPNGKEVAVKRLKAGSGQGNREFQAEVEIISRVHHRHLVSLVGYCITGTQRMLVYEFVPNNNLQFHLHGEGRPTMEWSNRLKIAIGAARGLAYLHEDCQPKIIHRDIKAANILLDFKFEAKVADFGLAKLTSETDTHVSTRVMGTFGYLAPDYAQSGKLTDKSDVYSFGVVLLELITGRKPVDTNNTYMDESLVDWARPLLTRATEDQNFEALADPRLNNEYEREEMASMVVCSAACVRHSARRRPRMSQIVRALEGEMSLKNLSEGTIRSGHSSAYSSGSTDYDTMKYNEDLRRFRRMAFGGGATSEYSGQSSDDYFGTNPSGSGSEQTTRELEKAKMKGSSEGFSGGSAIDE